MKLFKSKCTRPCKPEHFQNDVKIDKLVNAEFFLEKFIKK